MKIEFDKEADAAYVRFKKGTVCKTVKLKDRLLVDVDTDGLILGLEVLHASTQLPKKMLQQGNVVVTSTV